MTKLLPKEQSIFSEDNNSDIDRLTRYELRDDHHGHYNGGNSIFEHKFCFTCRSKECNDKSHDHRELHPALRIPKKNASKLHWKRFFAAYEKYGKDNSRTHRH